MVSIIIKFFQSRKLWQSSSESDSVFEFIVSFFQNLLYNKVLSKPTGKRIGGTQCVPHIKQLSPENIARSVQGKGETASSHGEIRSNRRFSEIWQLRRFLEATVIPTDSARPGVHDRFPEVRESSRDQLLKEGNHRDGISVQRACIIYDVIILG
jgi:hypothetical protein